MKQLLCILLALAMLLTAAACGGPSAPAEAPVPEQVPEEESAEEVLPPGQESAENAPKAWQAGVVYGLTDGCPYTFPMERTEATQTELERWQELMGAGQIVRFDARSMSERNGVVTPANAAAILQMLQSAELSLMEDMGNPNTGGSVELIALDLAGNKLAHCLYDQYWFTVQFGEEDTAYVFDGSIVDWDELTAQLTAIENIEELPWEEYLQYIAETKGLSEGQLRSLENMGFTRGEIAAMSSGELEALLADWQASADPQAELSAMFRLGLDGELREIAAGGQIGDWLVDELTYTEDGWVDAVFRGSLVLDCIVELDTMAEERSYIFTVSFGGDNCMPFHEMDPREGVWFRPTTNEGLEALADLEPIETRNCRVTLSEYRYSSNPMEDYPYACISAFELV